MFSARFITPNYEDDTIQGCRLIGCLELYVQGGRVHRSICTSGEQYISSLRIVDVGSPQDHQGRTTGKQHISSLRMVHVESSHRRQNYTTGEQHSSLLRTLHVGSPDDRQDCASGLLSSYAWLFGLWGAVGAEGATRLDDARRVSLLLKESQDPIFVSWPLGRYLCVCHS